MPDLAGDSQITLIRSPRSDNIELMSLMNFFRNLLSRPDTRQTKTAFSGLPTPVQPLCVIGDIHGRLDLLDDMIEKIQSDPDTCTADTRLVFVGDYVDRGENSRCVLNRLLKLSQDENIRAVCLRGNHEQMMIDFIDRPEERGGRWMRNGGLQTLASFGVGQVSATSGPKELIAARDKLLRAMPKGLDNWLRGLPLYWQNGNVAVIHAGADPERPFDQQDPKSLIWGHREFLKTPRSDGNWVVYGHFIVETAKAVDGRISVDTGAVFSNRLTAAHISDGSVEFLEVSPKNPV